MKFHLALDIKKAPTNILHTHSVMLVGSCFTENIGEKLRRHKFRVLENPNGILFNPVSVAEAISSYIDRKTVDESSLFVYNETWHSWKHHSRFSGITAVDALQKINTSIGEAHAYLKHADHLVLTLGSAWLYTLTDQAPNAAPGTVAANNHKGPAAWFGKRLMQPDEVVAMFSELLIKLRNFNPALQVIFTISPVRHLREGAVENNRSKAVLIQAVHTLAAQFDNIYYFPAYEIVIDDLRDYRFYAEDMVHPNYQATEYVWDKFTGACMTHDTRELMRNIAEINLAFQHRPFNPLTQQHGQFLQSYHNKTKLLQEQHPYLDFSAEIKYFSNQSQ